jgi:diguanylate cyclase (GGDEF)-like protein/PAS domain S-box-containing protein
MRSCEVDTPERVSEADDRRFGARFFEQLLDNLYDGVYFVDRNRTILYWNRGAERLTGYTRDEVIGRSCADNILCHTDASGCLLCYSNCPLSDSIARDRPNSARVLLRHKQGHQVVVDVQVMPMVDDSGEVIGGVEIFRDAEAVISLEAAYRKMSELAEKDPLTGAVNRRHAGEILSHQAEVLQRSAVPFSVIMTDIDHFKRVNDTLGHQAGDTALIAFERSLEQGVRQEDTVARMGGEEFLIILPGQGLSNACKTAARLREAAPFAIDDLRLTASFGVAEASPEESIDDLLARADAALYRAKAEGRDCVRIG